MMEMPHYVNNPSVWAEQVVEQFVNQPEQRQNTGLLIADICGTLIDADYGFHQYYTEAATKAGYEPTSIVPINVFRAEGHRTHLGHPAITSNYDALKKQLMHDSELHATMPPVAHSVELAEWGAAYGLPNGYLSTRPDVIGEATYQNLKSHGFADAPMLLRAEGTPYAHTVSYKVESLAVLRAELDTWGLNDLLVVFVDDYSQLVESVNKSGINLLIGVHFDADTSWGSIVRDHLGIDFF